MMPCYKKPGNRTQTKVFEEYDRQGSCNEKMTADVIKLSRSMVLKVSLGSDHFLPIIQNE